MLWRGRKRNVRLTLSCLALVLIVMVITITWEQRELDDEDSKDYEEFRRLAAEIQRNDPYGKWLRLRPHTQHGSGTSFLQQHRGLSLDKTSLPGSDVKRTISDRRRETCTEKTNLVYMKEIKCASTTLNGMFRRFGYERHLKFVLPIKSKIYLGWPYMIEKEYYRPLRGTSFNILCEHAVFDEERMRALMPSDTMYITSLREPFSQVKSMFHYYNFEGILKLDGDAFRTFIQNITYYDSLYKTTEYSAKRYCIPDGFSMAKNLMAYILGFPSGFLPGRPDKSTDANFVRSWLNYIAEQMDIVIIMEYFHESLILLKRKMCWNFKDILYLNKNVGQYNFRRLQDPHLVDIYRNWSSVDYELYDHFNRTLWKEVRAQGADFHDEVATFTDLLCDVNRVCKDLFDGKIANGSAYGLVDDPTINRWTDAFVVDTPLCKGLSEDEKLLELMQQQDDRAALDEDIESSLPVKFC